MPADLTEEEFIEREYWYAAPHMPPLRRYGLAHCCVRTRRRRVEGGEEQVTVDYANDLDTGMCVAGSSVSMCGRSLTSGLRFAQLRQRLCSNAT